MPNEEAILTTKVNVLRLRAPQEPWKIFLTGDLHEGANNHHAAGYLRLLRECLSLKKAGKPFRVIYTGDEQDHTSDSERNALAKADLHGATKDTLDAVMARRCMELVEMNKPIADHIVGFIQGNHYWRFATDSKRFGYKEGMTSTEYVCDKLGVNWLGFMSHINIRTVTPHGSMLAYSVVACHGRTVCNTAGGSINQVQNLRKIWPLADCYCLAHDHKLLVIKEPQLFTEMHGGPEGKDYGLENREHMPVKSKTQIMCRSGSQLKSYDPGLPSYAVGRMYHPSALGSVVLDIRAIRQTRTDQRTFCWEHTATI